MNVQLFYHCAIIRTWRRVVAEQMALFKSVGLPPKIGAVGPMDDAFGVLTGNFGDVVYHGPNVQEYETPTLQKLWEWCHDLNNPTEWAVIYAHTKGVSKPGSMRRAWRKLMEHWVVSKWKENLSLLRDHDAVGVNWRLSAPRWPTPHFAGTFWMARAEWINRLDAPVVHKKNGDYRWQAANKRADWHRMHAEMWIGSKPGIRAVSLACSDTRICRLPTLLMLLRQCGHPEYVSRKRR